MKQRPIMIMGTSSQAGKTTLVTGLCRIFADRGFKVAPFKAQNMSLNSYVTTAGEEIARAIEVQSRAARREPVVHMNPLLLKPKSDTVSQLIIHGRPYRDVSSRDYFVSDGLQELKLAAIRRSLAYLSQHYDLIIAEGAGSCAEPNLRRLDVVNMGVAHLLGARVFVVADIDKGGAFADILGTLRVMELTCPEDLGLVEGFILNKLRGDRTVAQPAIEFVEAHTGRPVIGVVPFTEVRFEEEDRVRVLACANPEIDVAVVHLPHISNANDADYLAAEENVGVRFVRSPRQLGDPDAIILPGTKNTVADLEYLRRVDFVDVLLARAQSTPIIGICGGYQMLGRSLRDDDRVESCHGTVEGLKLLDFNVEFRPDKVVSQRRCLPTHHNPFAAAGEVEGYEIHAGVVHYGDAHPLYRHAAGYDGAVHAELPIFGTSIHDIFKNPEFSRELVNDLRRRKGLEPLRGPLIDHAAAREENYRRFAAELEQELEI